MRGGGWGMLTESEWWVYFTSAYQGQVERERFGVWPGYCYDPNVACRMPWSSFLCSHLKTQHQQRVSDAGVYYDVLAIRLAKISVEVA